MVPLRLRALTAEERSAVEKLAHSRTALARQVERARIIWRASEGASAPVIAAALSIDAETVRRRVRRFNAEGLAALEDHPRSGRPATYSADEVAMVIATALTAPPEPAVRRVDAGPAGGVLARAEGHRDEAQPDRRDPASGRAALAQTGDLVRRAGRS